MLTLDRLNRLCQAREMLRDPRYFDRSVEDVASAICLSKFHFIRQFKALFGETPNRFRTRHRLEMAQRLLVLGEDSITDICMAVGFSSLGSFSTLFARQFGQSPSTYRRWVAAGHGLTGRHCMELLHAAWQSDRNFEEATPS